MAYTTYRTKKGKNMNTLNKRMIVPPLASAIALCAGIASAQELNVIIEEVPDYDIVRELTDRFMEEHPEITVTFDAMSFDAMRDRILTSSLAPTATYDIIIIDNPWSEEFANAGYLEPLDDYIAAADGYNYDDFVP